MGEVREPQAESERPLAVCDRTFQMQMCLRQENRVHPDLFVETDLPGAVDVTPARTNVGHQRMAVGQQPFPPDGELCRYTMMISPLVTHVRQSLRRPSPALRSRRVLKPHVLARRDGKIIRQK